jgi:hypothetical protein
MTAETPSLPPAGWYSDPAEAGKTRYWTGAAWGPQQQPAIPATPYAPAMAAQTPTLNGSESGNSRGGWSLGLGIAAVVLFWVPVLYLATSIAGGIVAIVLGVKGRRLAAQGAATNRGMATTGLVLGSIGLSLAGLNAIVGVILALQALQALRG